MSTIKEQRSKLIGEVAGKVGQLNRVPTRDEAERMIAAGPGWRVVTEHQGDDNDPDEPVPPALICHEITAWLVEKSGGLEPVFSDGADGSLVLARAIGRVVGILAPGESHPMEKSDSDMVDIPAGLTFDDEIAEGRAPSNGAQPC